MTHSQTKIPSVDSSSPSTPRETRLRPRGVGIRWGRLAGRMLATALLAGGVATGCTTVESIPASIDQAAAERPIRTTEGVVVSANEIASRVGAGVLSQGGNAVDAAVATGFALAVLHPSAGNIGGGGFMVVRFPDGRSTSIDFREKAPLASHPEMFVDENGEYSRQVQTNTHLAVGVPGTVAGFTLAHERYGNTEWRNLVQPAVDLARNGFIMTESLASGLERQVSGSMARYPASVAAFSNEGVPYSAGDVFRQPDLSRTLERIANEGRDGFYRGETARLIADDMRANGGIMTEEDLEAYQAIEREPIIGSFRGYEVISMPPPSSGGVALVQMLNILEGFDLRSIGHGTPEYFHLVTEAQRLAYRDRARHLADSDFWPVPIERLTSKDYAEELRAQIDPSHAGTSVVEDVTLAYESTETTHYSVVDADGLAVSVTYTLEAGYGSKITVPGGGFLLNNEMGDFNGWPGLTNETGRIGTEPNLTRAEQRMLSSMSPSILARDGELVAVIGSPGGRTIINTVLHLALNIAEFEMDPEDALAAPRSHHQWLPDELRIEEGAENADALADALRAMGHTVEVRGSQGQAHSVVVEGESGSLVGIPDPRSTDAGAAASTPGS